MLKINNKGTERLSTVFIVNFGRISHLFLLFLLMTLNKYRFTGPTLSIYKRVSNMLLQLLADVQKS